MAEAYLSARLDALRKAQNPDGGWGYFPGKTSWLEPTLFSALALHGDPASGRAWELLCGWQQADGSWRPSEHVNTSHSGAALCVTMACVRGEFGEPFRKGVAWLLRTEGSESKRSRRALAMVGGWLGVKPDRNLRLKGWPWKPGEASWVEPTSHVLVALKKASPKIASRKLRKRVRLGESQLLDVQCRDGGWNYGSRSALGVDLPSYPETTGLALFGLQGRTDVGPVIDSASRLLRETASPLARAWLTIALRLHGAAPDFPVAPATSSDL
ncbi:MAG TPA: hypothetical protein VFW83_04695, partial [Bryobacteraceae bacterium]|nr:hypothetical protein [Bryobacteraceae bacterium]